MKILYQIRLLLSHMILLAIIGFTVYLFVCAFTDIPFLIPTIIFFSSALILLTLFFFEDGVVKKKNNRYEKAISKRDYDSILNEKIRVLYSIEVKMKMIEYKAICNSIIGRYKEAKQLFSKIPYSFFLYNPELTLQSVFYLTLISMIEKDKEKTEVLSRLYLKRKKALKRYYTEKQMPFFDRRINNPDIMLKKIRILTAINNGEKSYKYQLIASFEDHKEMKLYNDIQYI